MNEIKIAGACGKRRPHFLLILFFALFILDGPMMLSSGERVYAAAPSRPRCDICGQSIRGRYYQSGTKDICMSCFTRYPKCAACGILVRTSSYRSHERVVCPDCAARLGRCDNCGDVLLGEFIRSKKGLERFCGDCFAKKPKCARCGLPFRDLQKVGENYLCRNCLQLADRCSSCGEPILGKYYKIQYVPGRYCKTCFDQRPHCDICGRPIVSGGRQYPDGRRSCAVCAATAVTSMEEARKMLTATMRYLGGELSMCSNVPFDFALVDNSQMARLHDRKPGKSVKELGLYGNRLTPLSTRPTIAILIGLPRSAFLETVAHEYAHHWQIQNNPRLQELTTIEGFAQWAAAQWLVKNKIYSGFARIESNPDPVYGEGYRRMRKYALDKGAPALLRDILLVQGNDLKLVTAPAIVAQPEALSRALVAKTPVPGPASAATPAVVNPGAYLSVILVDPTAQ